MTDFKKTVEKCPLCDLLVTLTEQTACAMLRKYNPKLDDEACRRVLRLKLNGKSTSEIAKSLNVPANTLVKVISESLNTAEKAIESKIKKQSGGVLLGG